jgi:hypothetical protein
MGSAGQFATEKRHYPEAARAYAETSVQQVIGIAKSVGPETTQLIESLFRSPTPLRNLRRAQGIVRLGKDHGKEKLEHACKRANALNQKSYQFLERILKTGHQSQKQLAIRRGENEFLRGQEHFH